MYQINILTTETATTITDLRTQAYTRKLARIAVRNRAGRNTKITYTHTAGGGERWYFYHQGITYIINWHRQDDQHT
jgi:hypothetical protein